jgi:AcrR family transcriptional regulator
MSGDGASTPRPYDARRRRERAEVDRARTRRQILGAAGDLFLGQGYAGTTIAAIAARAGISVQTVYSAIGGKVDLLRAVTASAVTGSAQNGAVLDQQWVAALAAASEPLEQVRLLSAALTGLAERAAPFWRVIAEAALDDPRFAEDLREHEAGRIRDQGEIVRLLRGLRADLSTERAVDMLNVIASPQMWQFLVVERGWTRTEVEAFLFRTLALHLLDQAV